MIRGGGYIGPLGLGLGIVLYCIGMEWNGMDFIDMGIIRWISYSYHRSDRDGTMSRIASVLGCAIS